MGSKFFGNKNDNRETNGKRQVKNSNKNSKKNYSTKLSKKKELVVLNKTDLIDKRKVKDIVDNFSKNIKSEVITVSTLEKKTISKIKAKLISYAS